MADTDDHDLRSNDLPHCLHVTVIRPCPLGTRTILPHWGHAKCLYSFSVRFSFMTRNGRCSLYFRFRYACRSALRFAMFFEYILNSVHISRTSPIRFNTGIFASTETISITPTMIRHARDSSSAPYLPYINLAALYSRSLKKFFICFSCNPNIITHCRKLANNISVPENNGVKMPGFEPDIF